MTYRETFFFIASCLTISFEKKNKKLVLSKLKSEDVDWDKVVKLSSEHYVLPALYCNLKRVNFLNYLPRELDIYLKKISDINRERNYEIIKQAKKLNKILSANKISPIFLKGTGNLLDNLYDDIAERMVGDIDFICSKKEYPKAIKILSKNGYFPVNKTKYSYPEFLHYRRIKKKKMIAAVEIHKELTVERYSKEFNYKLVEKNVKKTKDIKVLGYKDQLILSILGNQINDNGYYYKSVSLRNAYDVFLLSKKTNAKDAINSLDKLTYILNCFLSASYEVFNKVDSLEYDSTKKLNIYLRDFNYQLNKTSKNRRRYNRIKNFLFIRSKIIDIYKNFTHKDFRVWLFKTLTNKKWYYRKLNQFGIKK